MKKLKIKFLIKYFACNFGKVKIGNVLWKIQIKENLFRNVIFIVNILVMVIKWKSSVRCQLGIPLVKIIKIINLIVRLSIKISHNF